ncbi:MAG: branched-chain amino acid ABC transporter permease [Candidatus Caldarchaeum sp.]
MDITLFLEQTMLGLMMGGIYAAVGAGLTMIFGVMKLSNFAHGEFYMLGAFFVYTLVLWTGGDPYIMAPLSAIFVGFLGIIFNKLIFLSLYKELRQVKGGAAFFFQDLRFIMLTIGLSILLVDFALVVWGPIPISIPSIFTSYIVKIPGGFSFSIARIITFIMALLSLFLLYLFLLFTKTGKAIRATSQNPLAASLVGINTYRVYDITMFISTSLAALAGGILGPIYNIYPTMGLDVVAKAFVVVITGGMGNLVGTILAGFMVGLAENWGGLLFGTEYRQVVAFIIMILVLWFRPQGIAGRGRV